MAGFAHLRVHSAYSLSEGASKIDALVATAHAQRLPALALTDRNNMFGAMSFSKLAASKGIQPIVGCQLHLPFGAGKFGNILLLVQNQAGYANLCHILASATRPDPEGAGKPGVEMSCIDPDALAERSEGLILLTGGGRDGLLPQMVAQSPERAEEMFRWLLSVFGDRLYVEICRSEVPTGAAAAQEEALIALAMGAAGPVPCQDGVERAEAPLVATADVWYATPDRHDAWVLLNAVANKKSVTIDGGAIVDAGPPVHALRPPEEMAELFADLPEAYDNAVNLARRCAFMVKGRKPILPPFHGDGGRSEADELRAQAVEGLRARLAKAAITGAEADRRWQRLDYELGVIEKMGFPGYFLIVSDFIKWAKNRGIPVGPGRGSGAGSIVAWALTITDLDPMEFNLLFERFLNPERVSMPDFDIDFCQDRRDEVREYVKQKYGADRVALISTFGYIKSRTALTDMQRILVDEQFGAVSFSEVKDLTKAIPKKEDSADPMGLMEAYEKEASFRERVESSAKLKGIFVQSCKVEGLIRTSGAHAAGLVIADRPLDELVPLSYDAEAGMRVTGFDMKGVEDAGLVKFDFLGLTTLSVLNLAQRYVREARGQHIDLEAIPRDDETVYRMLSAGQCAGVFQFEGSGMRKVMRQIRPARFEDLIAIVALFRPGPMAYIDNYAARKAGHEEFAYPGDRSKTEPFLSETYGIMVYQEQVMQVAQACAGYSLGGADLLRRAMGKKIQSEMDIQRRVFVHGNPHATPPIPGAVALGMSEAAANSLFDDIVPFAGYGFNKSHAAAYAWIGYQTAWMKVHYPAEYLSALMTYYIDNPERLAIIKEELDLIEVPLLPPDINKSTGAFRPERMDGVKRGGYGIRFGLSAIKQVSSGEALAAERAQNGPYTSLEDFHTRVGAQFNKAQYERLAEAGAFDGLARSRRQAAEILVWLSEHKKSVPRGQGDLFGSGAEISVPRVLMELPEWENMADREFKSVGFYFNIHPLDAFVPRLRAAGVRRRKSIFQWMLDKNLDTLDGRKLCCLVDAVNIRQSKRGTTYIEAIVSEKSDSYRVACYENRRSGMSIDSIRHLLEGAKVSRHPVVFACSLAMDRERTGLWVNAHAVWHVEKFLANIHGEIVIRLDPDIITLKSDEHAIIRQAIQAHGSGSAAHAEAELAARAAATRRIVTELSGHLESYARSSAAHGSAVALETPQGRVRLPNFYSIPTSITHIIRQTDGVVSVLDFITQAPAAAAELAPAA